MAVAMMLEEIRGLKWSRPNAGDFGVSTGIWMFSVLTTEFGRSRLSR